MSVFYNNALIGASGQAVGGYEIERSLRFNSSDSAYLSRTPASAGNRKTWTWAGWVKRSGLGTEQTLFMAGTVGIDGGIWFRSDNRIECYSYNGSYTYQKQTAQLFRDTSAWYHVVHVLDTDNATAEDRVRLYVNGVRVTDWSTSSNPTQGTSAGIINTTYAHIVSSLYGSARYFSGYLADIHFIDGQALDPTSFGEFDTNAVWQPIEYTGTYGTNGFHLPFSDNSTAAALGTDTSGNSNTWTVNNISVAAGSGNDSLVDTPTSYGTDTGAGGEVRGNYATLNAIWSLYSTATTLTNGNLDYVSPGGIGTTANIGMSSGKWYCEVNISSSDNMIGIYRGQSRPSNNSFLGHQPEGYGYYSTTGNKYNSGSNSAYGASYASGDVIGIAFDADAGTLVFYKNGASQGTAFTGLTSGPYFFAFGNGTSTGSFNFGQRPFAYTAPSGYKALCTTNLPAPVVAQPSTVMDVKLYTGNGSTQTISGLGFSPDLVWTKQRSGTEWHYLIDIVRGNTKALFSNASNAEFTTGSNVLTAFNSDGYSLGSDSAVNASSNTYVAWAWDAGSSTTTNNSGSISSQVRANASAGFSIVTYSGNSVAASTVGHGLGVTPSMVIVKRRDSARGWYVSHIGYPNTSLLFLESTSALATSEGTRLQRTNSTVFTVGDAADYGVTNESGGTYVAYCFAPVDGYSSFGSYTGNGSTDGPFVYTGFRPAFVLLKCSSTAGTYWTIHDNKRLGYNPDQDLLFPNASDAENSTSYMDFLSNGFKLRISSSFANASGETFVWAAFAESPQKYARAR